MNPTAHRFHVLDSLRGLCALLVVLFHARFLSPVLTLELVRSSWQFVDFFFVLSGFVIATNYRSRLAGVMPVSDFVGLRLGRIYPLHFAVLMAYLMMELLAVAAGAQSMMAHTPFTDTYSVEALITNLLLLQSFGLHDGLTWNQPAWSIATEFWCYVLFAIGVVVTGRNLERWLVGVVLICPLVLLRVTPYGINATSDWGMVRCIFGFSLGVLCWHVWQGRFGKLQVRRSTWTFIEVMLLIAIGFFVGYAASKPINVLGPPLFALAVLVFAHGAGAVSSLLSMRLPLWLGTLSYSIYMVHQFVQSRMNDVANVLDWMLGKNFHSDIVLGEGVHEVLGTTIASGTLMLALYIVLVLLTSMVTYRYIERPGQRWSREWVNSRKAARACRRDG